MSQASSGQHSRKFINKSIEIIKEEEQSKYSSDDNEEEKFEN